MQKGKNSSSGHATTLLVFVVVFALFYGMNLMIMDWQGLPLNLDLTPAK